MNRRNFFSRVVQGSAAAGWAEASAGGALRASGSAETASKAAAKETLLLRDFHPVSMLHVPVHEVERARFPVIDVHNHVNDARRSSGERIPPARVIEVMDHSNLQTIVILTGMWGEYLQAVLDEMVKPYPGRFVVFTQIDWKRVDEPDFSGSMVKQIDDAVARGARGLKVLKDFGLTVRHKSGELVKVDDPELDPIWADCGRLGIPVAIHTTDPEAFFHPVNGENERFEELLHHPDWSFYGHQFPSKESLLTARERVFARHSGTTFIALHVGNWPENLDYVSQQLDRLPNVVIEVGARQAEIGRQPRRAREFFEKYQDRILFGTDMTPEEGLYRNWFRFLETADDSFDYWGAPEQGRWKIYGLNLPDEILNKVYRRNAERIFGQYKG